MPLVLYLLASAVFVMGTSEFMLAGLVPAIATDLHVPVGAAGLLTSSFAIGMVVGAPLMAAAARTWPPRRSLLICLSVFAASHVLAALAPDLTLLVITRVVGALANAGFLAVALSTAVALVPAGRGGRAVAVLLAGTTVSMIVGVPAGAVLGEAAGWRSTFWAIAICCLPALLGIAGGLPRSRSRIEHDPRGPDLRTELGALRSPGLLLTMLLAAVVNGGTFAAFTFLAPVVTEVAGLRGQWVPVALVAFGAGSFAGVTLAGRLSDARPGLVLGVGAPLLTAGWVALGVGAGSAPVLLILVLVQGCLAFAVGSTLIARVLAASAGAPRLRGAYATSALNLGAACGPVLGAASLAGGTGPLGPVWVAAALAAVALGTIAQSHRLLTAKGPGATT